MKINRVLSFVFIFIVYVLAVLAGLVMYSILDLPFWLSLLIADVASTVVVFIFSLIFNNASVYDPYWSVQPVVIVVAFAIVEVMTPIKILFAVVIGLWGLRLTANWAYTFKGMEYQDWRYTMLKDKTDSFYPVVNFLGIHLVPTLIVYACILPVVYVFKSGCEGNVYAYLFMALSMFAVCLQGVADCQMHKFRKDKKGQNFIRIGVWKYSRHPNYLAEILMWWGIGFAAVFSLWGRWYLLSGALLNTLLFLFVSMPMADKRQSSKEGYNEYKSQTRMLIPIKKVTKNK